MSEVQAAEAVQAENQTAESVETAKEVSQETELAATDAAADQITEDSANSVEEKNNDIPGDDATADTEVKKGVQKRIDELTAKRREAERERDYYRSLAESSQTEEEISEPVKPQMEDFAFDTDKFSDAMDSYAEKLASWVNHQSSIEKKQREQQLEAQRKQWAYQDRANAYAKDNPDFFQVVNNESLAISQEMSDVILSTENGPSIAHYLGKNPEIAKGIASLPKTMQYVEMGKLVGEIASKKAASKVVTTAPAPIKPVGSNNSVSKNPAEMSYDEFVAWRQKTKSARN